MVDNPTKIYNDYVRANLPNSMSYDTGTDRYDINSHSFFKFKNSNWYFNYISKYGYSALSAYAVNGLEPALVFDFKGNYFRKSATDSTFGASITHSATTNATMTDGYGPNLVTNGDFASDSGWDKGTGWTISGGVATHSGGTDGNLNNTGYTVSAPSNKTFTITYTISGHTAGSVRVGLAGGNAQYLTHNGANGTYTGSVTNTGGNLYVRFQTAGFLGSIDNVSVREAPALKWRPHNLLTHSGDLTNANWTNNGLTVTTGQNDFEGNPTAFKVTPTTVSGFHRLYKNQVNSNLVNGILSTVTIDLKADGYNFFSVATNNQHYAVINLSDGSVSLDTNSVSPTVTSLGNGWYRCSITSSTVSQEVFSVGETAQTASFGSQNFTGDGTSGVLVAYPHSFRISLGGMVNNPDASTGRESYLPTTTTPAYAPRRGHHIYNGSAWVNEGILHESEARTNQMLYSDDLTRTAWTGAVTVGTVTAGSPFGTFQTLSPLNNSVNLGGAQRYQIGKSITSGSTYVGWALVKYSVGSGWFIVNMYDTGKSNEQAFFDLQNGVVGSKQPLIIDHGMVDYGDGWWLCWASSEAASGSGGVSYEVPNGDGVQSCSAADVILIAGTQFELGSTPSSYIPTASATVTRADETLTVPASNLPYPAPVEVTGTELVTNGDFSDGLTGWTQNANATGTSNVIGGQLVQTAPHGDYSETKQLNGSTVGKTYLCSFKVTAKVDSSTSVFINFGRTPVYSGPIANIPIGVFSGVVTSVHPDGFSISTRTDGQITIDNVSVKEVSYKLSIQMDGKMTYADNGLTPTTTGGAGEVSFLLWKSGSTDYISTGIDTGGSRLGQYDASQRSTNSGGQQLSQGSTTDYSPNTNVPFNIASRHGSTFINGATEGTLTTSVYPSRQGLPDLSSTDLDLGFVFMGTIGEFRMWSDDLGDVGITEATLPSTEPSLSLTFDGSENSFIVLDWSE